MIDSRRVKSAEQLAASIDPHGCGAGRKITGNKQLDRLWRSSLVDAAGLLPHPANLQDRDGGPLVPSRTDCCMLCWSMVDVLLACY